MINIFKVISVFVWNMWNKMLTNDLTFHELLAPAAGLGDGAGWIPGCPSRDHKLAIVGEMYTF